MHEYSLMESVLDEVLRDLEARGISRPGRVKEVRMTVGALDIHSRESFIQAFTIIARGTPLEDARFILDIEAATLTCPNCGHDGPVGEDEADGHRDMPVAECTRCGRVSAVQGGRGIKPIELVLDES